jgi:hypothetical protein
METGLPSIKSGSVKIFWLFLTILEENFSLAHMILHYLNLPKKRRPPILSLKSTLILNQSKKNYLLSWYEEDKNKM